MSKLWIKTLLATLIAAASMAAQAVPAYYTNQASFNAAAGSLTSLDLSTPQQAGPTLNFPGLTVTIPDWFGSYANDLFYGGNGVQGYTNVSAAFTFDFASPITAFGATITDLGTVGPSDFSVSVYSGATLLGSQVLFASYAGSLGGDLFAGIIDAGGFDRLVFGGTVWGDYVEIKSVQVGSGAPVPEPATLALMGIALAGMGALRRRKQ